jgi:hypothetical protein
LGRLSSALIFQEVEEMQGEVVINDWKVALEGDKFDPKFGTQAWDSLFDLDTCG